MQNSAEKKWTLLLLCWFLGLGGGHRFYTHKYGTAFVQLFALILFGVLAVLDLGLLSVAILLGLFVWLLVDAVRIVAGRFTDREGLRVVRWA